MLGEEEEEDDTSLGLRGPALVAVWPWAQAQSCSDVASPSVTRFRVGGWSIARILWSLRDSG